MNGVMYSEINFNYKRFIGQPYESCLRVGKFGFQYTYNLKLSIRHIFYLIYLCCCGEYMKDFM